MKTLHISILAIVAVSMAGCSVRAGTEMATPRGIDADALQAVAALSCDGTQESYRKIAAAALPAARDGNIVAIAMVRLAWIAASDDRLLESLPYSGRKDISRPPLDAWMAMAQSRADKGEPFYLTLLAIQHIFANFLPKDVPKGMKILEDLAAKGDPFAHLQLALVMYNTADKLTSEQVSQIIAHAETAAEKGMPSGYYNLGCNYYEGRLFPQDDNKAFDYFSKAVNAGMMYSARNLAICYLGGYGVKRDIAKAGIWFRKAVESGDIRATPWLLLGYFVDAITRPTRKRAQIPGGFYLYTLSGDKLVRIASDGTQTTLVIPADRHGGLGLLNGELYTSDNGRIRIHDLDGKELRTISIPKGITHLNLVVIPDGRIALLDSESEKVYFLSKSGELLATTPIVDSQPGHLQNLDGVVAGDQLIVSGDGYKRVISIDLNTYQRSIFADLSHLPLFGLRAATYDGGSVYATTVQEIFRFGADKTLTKVADVPERAITGLVVTGNYAFAVSIVGYVYEIDLSNETYRVFASGLIAPERLKLTVGAPGSSTANVEGNAPAGSAAERAADATGVSGPVPQIEMPTEAAASAVTSAVEKGLILSYTFDKDEGETITDESPKGNNGRIRGTTWAQEGGRNGCLHFDGAGSSAEVQPFNGLDAGGDFTLSLWAKPSYVEDHWCAVLATEAFRVELTGDRRIHWDWTSQGNNSIYTLEDVFDLNEWVHLVLVKKDGNLTFYLDGQPINKQQTVRSDTKVQTLRLGMDGLTHIGGDDFYAGQIDEVRIYDCALTPAEAGKLREQWQSLNPAHRR